MAIKKTTKVETTSQEEIDRMSDLSDEKNTKAAPKFPLASLKVNGKEGSYYKTVLTDDELAVGEDGKAKLEKVEDPIGVILRPRKSYNFVGPDYQLFTNEGGNTPKSVFSVFEKRETKKGFSINLVFQGIPAQLKEKFPELKMTQIVYFLMDETNELVRLKVKGMSLGKIFDYWKEFGATEHLFQYKTILGEEKGKNQFGKFIMSTFKKGEKVKDFTEIKKAMELISEKVNAIEAYYKDRDAEMIEFNSGNQVFDVEKKYDDGQGSTEEKPEKDEVNISSKAAKAALRGEEEEEEIDVKTIPFG